VSGKIHHLSWIWGIWRKRPRLIALLFVLTLLSSAVAVVTPYLTKLLFDTFEAVLKRPGDFADPQVEVVKLVVIFISFGFVGLIAGFFPGVRGAMNSVFEHFMRTFYFESVLSKDSDFFRSFRTGDIVTRLTDDLYDFPKLSWFLCSGIFRAVESFSKVIFCIVAMVLIDWRLTLWALLPVPFIVLVFYFLSDRIETAASKNQQAISAINNQLEMSFSGVRIIKAFASENEYRRFFDKALAHRFDTEMGIVKIEVFLGMLFQFIDYVAQIVILIAGGFMAVRGEITIGTFYAFYNYLRMLVYPILDLPQLFVSGKRAFVNIDRLEEMKRFPAREKPESAIAVKSIDAVEFDNVSFRYEGREAATLSEISFGIKRGERICIVGPVGCGKTTIVKLLLGLIAPASGNILVNGIPAARIDNASFRDKVGYVPQDPLLFSGTIRQNVDFGVSGGQKTVTDALFDKAIDIAQMSDEIASFSEGAGTVIGQRGVSLSGGQKQRVAIARAIARNPDLLLLDDITASLDATKEELLMNGLSDFSADCACLIVSHRLSTLQYVDKILFLENGQVEGFGTHEELLRKPSYASFISEHFAERERVS
jgi:ATP-binding cassette subfamily B protein